MRLARKDERASQGGKTMKCIATMFVMMLVVSLAQAEERISSEDAAICLAAGIEFADCTAFAAEQRRGSAPSTTTTPATPTPRASGVSGSEFNALRDDLRRAMDENQAETNARLDSIETQNRDKDDELARLRAENERLRSERSEREVLLERAEAQVASSTELLSQSERMYRDLIEEVERDEREASPRRDPAPSVGYAPPVPVEETIIYLHQPRTIAGMSWETCMDDRSCMEIYNQSPWPIELDIGNGTRIVVDQRFGMPDLSGYQTPNGPVTLIPPRTRAFVFLGYPRKNVYPNVTAYSQNYGFWVPTRTLNMGRKSTVHKPLDIRKDMTWNLL